MRPEELAIGDWVQRRDSSLSDVGRIIELRDANYVVVEWQDHWISTQRRDALRFLARRPAGRDADADGDVPSMQATGS